jgi:hypothetical protein
MEPDPRKPAPSSIDWPTAVFLSILVVCATVVALAVIL